MTVSLPGGEVPSRLAGTVVFVSGAGGVASSPLRPHELTKARLRAMARRVNLLTCIIKIPLQALERCPIEPLTSFKGGARANRCLTVSPSMCSLVMNGQPSWVPMFTTTMFALRRRANARSKIEL